MTTERTLRQAVTDLGELLARHEGGRDLDQYARYAHDPVAFLHDVLDAEPWSAQAEIAVAVRDRPQVTVRSCHAAGKDFLAARLSLWWVYAKRGLVILTGPTAAQVEEILMRGEVRTAFVGSGLPGSLHAKALRPGGEGKAGILARTATGVQGLQGWHDARVLFVVTEAQDPEIDHAWDAAFNCTTGADDRKLMVGNPTEPGTRFHRAHQPGSDWHAVKIAADDVPNVRQGETVVPGLLTREGVERFASEYGRDSAVYTSRVQAEFPEEGSDSLIKRQWIDDAFERHEAGEYEHEARRTEAVVGLDVARFGRDASVACVRRGRQVVGFHRWQGEDTKETARRALQVVHDHHDPERAPVSTVVVDTVGVGAGVADQLRDEVRKVRWAESDGWGSSKLRTATLVEFKAGSKAPNSDQFKRLRAQAFWRLRKELEEGRLALPRDEGLRRELLALRTEVTPAGKVALASKRAGLGGDSPDRADALSMTFRPDLESSRKEVWFR